ncbi:MAG: hypothetical protein HPY66_3222 [Firmicutes bacterium]|nr:hypothetical protein [Bacillota bacterium]
MEVGIFVSGTYLKNEDFRNAVYEVFRSKPVRLITMEDFPSSEKASPQLCRERLEMASYYILIVNNRYGWIPPGYDKAITELEYEWAIELKMPMKIYIYKPGNDALLTGIADKERLDAFKKRLRENHSPRDFGNADELKYFVLSDFGDWQWTNGYLQDTSAGTNITGLNIRNLKSTNQVSYVNIDIDYHREQLGEVYEEQLNRLINPLF